MNLNLLKNLNKWVTNIENLKFNNESFCFLYFNALHTTRLFLYPRNICVLVLLPLDFPKKEVGQEH